MVSGCDTSVLPWWVVDRCPLLLPPSPLNRLFKLELSLIVDLPAPGQSLNPGRKCPSGFSPSVPLSHSFQIAFAAESLSPPWSSCCSSHCCRWHWWFLGQFLQRQGLWLNWINFAFCFLYLMSSELGCVNRSMMADEYVVFLCWFRVSQESCVLLQGETTVVVAIVVQDQCVFGAVSEGNPNAPTCNLVVLLHPFEVCKLTWWHVCTSCWSCETTWVPGVQGCWGCGSC